MRILKRKSKYRAPAIVYYAFKVNSIGQKLPLLYVECTYGGTRVGPGHSHSGHAQRKLLAELTRRCGCGRPIHHGKFLEGQPIRSPRVASSKRP